MTILPHVRLAAAAAAAATDESSVASVGGMDGQRHVGKHRFGPRGRRDELWRPAAAPAFRRQQRIGDVVQHAKLNLRRRAPFVSAQQTTSATTAQQTTMAQQTKLATTAHRCRAAGQREQT